MGDKAIEFLLLFPAGTPLRQQAVIAMVHCLPEETLKAKEKVSNMADL
jgi:hypothetical protein